MNSLNNLINTPQFSQYTEPESCALLSHTDCSICGHVMTNGPYGIASVPVSCKDRRSSSRFYYIFYHTVCESCFEVINLELDAVPTTNIPQWSLMGYFLNNRDDRKPLHSAAINCADDVFDMLKLNYTTFDSWAEFNDAAVGAFDEYAYSDAI
jgi:hypothetical protein